MRVLKAKWPLVIIGGLLLVTVAGLGTVQARQSGQRGRLGNELAVAEEGLRQYELEQASSQSGEMKSRLSNVLTYRDTAIEDLSQYMGTITANETLFGIARECNVTITAITILNEYGVDLAGVPCLTTPVSVSVEGDLPDVLDFVTSLNTSVTNGLVKSADVTAPDIAESDEMPTASIELIIYTYEGE